MAQAGNAEAAVVRALDAADEAAQGEAEAASEGALEDIDAAR